MMILLKRRTARLASLAAVVVLTGCVTNSETGRSQMLMMSQDEETALGTKSFEELKRTVPISKNAAANEQLQRVGRRIASQVNLPGAQWEFVLFESKEANAFCLPGGKVGVYTGILPITATDAGLATVLGHEVAHATLHHGNERMSRAMVVQNVGSIGGILLGQAKIDPTLASAAMQAYGIGAQVGSELPHSRFQESEADKQGLFYMARAGYDPAEAVKFWQRFSQAMKSASGSEPWYGRFLRTHPVDAERIANLQKLQPEARAQYRPQ